MCVCVLRGEGGAKAKGTDGWDCICSKGLLIINFAVVAVGLA